MSNLTAFSLVGERSEATPGLFNRIFSILSDNIRTASGDLGSLTLSSGDTFSISSHVTISGRLAAREMVHVGTVPSSVTVTALQLGVSSAVSDYIHFADTSGAKSSYIIGSRVGGTADGLNIWDQSGSTMIVSFSKQSVRFYQNVVGPVFDVGGALADTLNAATFGTGADSKESRIQAAIDQASISGISRVYIPANMYPYSASSISFIYPVQMIREGGSASVYDVRAYGAAGDLIQDDTAAVQAACNTAQGTGNVLSVVRLPRGQIYLPPGYYKLTSEILIQGTAGLIMSGDGPVTSLLVFASSITNGLHIDGVAHSLFQDIGVTTLSGSTVTNLINCDWSVGISRNPTGNMFRNILINPTPPGGAGKFVYGVAVGTSTTTNTPTNAIDQFTFDRVRVLGSWATGNLTNSQAGFQFGAGTADNNLGHCFYNCENTDVAIGFHFYGSSGVLYGGANENCGTDVVANPPSAEIKVSGMRMEGSLQLFSLPAYASGAQSVEIENIAFAGNALVAAMTYPLVLYNWAGALSLRNIYIYDAAHAGAVTTIEVNPGGGTAPLTVIADNISVTNSQTLAQTFVSTFGGPQAFLVRGFTVKNAAENVIDYIPEQLYNNLTAGTTSKGAIFTTVTGNDGTAILPTYVTASEASLGWYRSAASTMALSYGTLWPQGTLWVTSGISAKSSVASFSYTSSSRTAMERTRFSIQSAG